jgi:macrolide-specific efflux system membrane fusion protein
MARSPLPALVLLGAAALAGCGLFPREEKVLAPPVLSPPEVAYDTVEAKRGTIVLSVMVSAAFVSSDEARLTFRNSSGYLARIAVHGGEEVKKGQLIAELQTAGLEARIAQSRLQVRKAELLAERATALGRDRFEREIAELDVQIARLVQADLERELSEARILAPLAGVVVYLVNADEGDAIEAWQTVAQIADPRRLELLYRGEQAIDFAQGMQVKVEVKGRLYPGEVVQSPTSAPADAPDDMRQAVLFRMASLPPGVGLGDTAIVSVVLARRSGVIVLPRDLVLWFGGRSYIQVLEQGIRQERSVELGLQTPTEVEVVRGLDAGESVIRP